MIVLDKLALENFSGKKKRKNRKIGSVPTGKCNNKDVDELLCVHERREWQTLPEEIK